jgi:uncharacterized protein YbaR (Trm112 family)
MTPRLLQYLCDPETKEPLALVDSTCDEHSRIQWGRLVSRAERSYPTRNGISRFVPSAESAAAVASYGDEWNTFNFTDSRSTGAITRSKTPVARPARSSESHCRRVPEYFSRPQPIGCALRIRE